MSVKVWLKSRVADRVLSPVREELIELIEPCATLLDIGSGTGDLIFRSAPKLAKGLGIDSDKGMINYAEEKRRKEGVGTVKLACIDVRDAEWTLFLH